MSESENNPEIAAVTEAKNIGLLNPQNKKARIESKFATSVGVGEW